MIATFLVFSGLSWLAFFIGMPLWEGEEIKLPAGAEGWFGSLIPAVLGGTFATILLIMFGVVSVETSDSPACDRWEFRGRGMECVD
ncbi:hypothetical protein GCM10011367_17320 [Marinicauda pacifica]|nr:hypothetical protein GCM10011367_17320 [Marinicauda pacifica]